MTDAPTATPAEHFDDLHQQHEASEMAMWLFLATEVMLFGVMFTGYLVYRMSFPEAWDVGSHHLYLSIGSINTTILILSSLTMTLAYHAAVERERRALMWLLALTAALGALFLGLKGLEYYLDVKEHIVPAFNFQSKSGVNPRHVQMFLWFYFVMTAVHTLHLSVAVIVVAVLAWFARGGRFVSGNANWVQMTSLYWHFVDIIWVTLFALLYLV